LAAERRTSKPNQPNSLTVIKYVGRNSWIGEHDMITMRTKDHRPNVEFWRSIGRAVALVRSRMSLLTWKSFVDRNGIGIQR
jgi:hypothetical protein